MLCNTCERGRVPASAANFALGWVGCAAGLQGYTCHPKCEDAGLGWISNARVDTGAPGGALTNDQHLYRGVTDCSMYSKIAAPRPKSALSERPLADEEESLVCVTLYAQDGSFCGKHAFHDNFDSVEDLIAHVRAEYMFDRATIDVVDHAQERKGFPMLIKESE